MAKKVGCKYMEQQIRGKCYKMANSDKIHVGDKVKTYSMFTKRYRTNYIVKKKGKGCFGISSVKNGGESGTRCVGDIFKEAK